MIEERSVAKVYRCGKCLDCLVNSQDSVGQHPTALARFILFFHWKQSHGYAGMVHDVW